MKDLSGEVDPTEQMLNQQEQAQDRAEQGENLRNDDHDGSVTTEEYDVQDALSNL